MRIFRRFYICCLRALPFFFILFGVGNFYFLFKKTSADTNTIYKNLSQLDIAISNRIVFVESFVSNQIKNARNQIRYIKTSFSTNTLSSVSVTTIPTPSNLVSSVNVQGRYFVSSSVPQVDIDGFYFGKGDDFGYGEIEKIFPRVVLTKTHIITLSPPPPAAITPQEPNKPQFALIEDYPTAAEYAIHARYLSEQLEKGQFNTRTTR